MKEIFNNCQKELFVYFFPKYVWYVHTVNEVELSLVALNKTQVSRVTTIKKGR